MDVKIEELAYAFKSCIRTLFYCARERAYYVLSTDSKGDSLVFPCRSNGKVITFSDVFEAKREPAGTYIDDNDQSAHHANALCLFMAADPVVIRKRLELNNELGG